jgi:putative flippase GtrA
VGGFATLIDWAIYSFLILIVRLDPIIATSISFVFGLIVNYYLTQIWVFNYTPSSLAKSFTTFTIIGLVGLGLNYVLFRIDDNYHLLANIFKISNQDYINMLKKVGATCIVYIWNFSARKYFIFRETKKPAAKNSFIEFYKRNRTLILALLVLVIGYYFMYMTLKQDILSHSAYEAYSLQAKAWWQGRADLGQDYPWLELAYYNHKVYVSFPPVPSVAQFVLMPFFGGAFPPDNLLTTIYGILCFVVTFLFFKRRKLPESQALFWSVFLIFGGNLLAVTVSGGVWFQAQVLCFLLTMLSLYLITSEKKIHWHLGLLCWALSIGCRPFQALYFPIYLYILSENLKQHNEINKVKDLLKFFSYAILPLLVFIAYGWYNWIRFGNPLEFGHTYLPEFIQAKHGQFSVEYFWGNFPNIFRLPNLISGTSRFTVPRYDGFLFLIANPIFIPFLVRWFQSIFTRKINFYDIVIPLLIVMHIILLCCHRTLGGWQFGTRYLVDFLPYVFFYIYQKKTKFYPSEWVLLAFGVMLNIYGTAWLFLEWP